MFGHWELLLILLIVVMLFGVGRLPEVFGSVGKGIREFRKASTVEDEDEENKTADAATATATADSAERA
ncbi:twin-arginine translocase TatA/TatE family subunit [Chloroflexi bacterium TSY]|nr:twin-arginine translocase TatA/TatE family subunit [Chloroflexi bacterium TSY]